MRFQARYITLLLIDAILINSAFYIMLLLRFDGHIPGHYLTAFMQLMPLISLISIAFLVGLKLYNRIWVYASIGEMMAILRATTFSVAIIVMTIYLFKLPTLPRSVYIGSWVFMTVLIGASRVWWRILRNNFSQESIEKFENILIVGAGNAGAILLKEIKNNPRLKMNVKGLVDDDPGKQGMILYNVPILGTRKHIPSLVTDLEIDEIIIAIPSASGETIRQLVDICRKTHARLRILPGIYQSAKGLLKNLRDVRMEDLLRREPVKINLTEIASYISDKTVLVTGAGGSIGSELCRQVAGQYPKELIILDCCENNLFEIEIELKDGHPDISVFPALVDIRLKGKLEKVFEKYRPQVVFHAAAYKHVPMMEIHPEEAIENNVIGSLNMARLSDSYGVETLIFISTDKAVHPTSVMGASKRIAELTIQEINSNSPTRFASVRFGNVLGSRGSVIPTFIKQIEKGGPVTVTDPKMERFFMTIPEAVELVIQAGAMAEGGEIFILDMGEMIKIDDLARDLIRLAGYEPDTDIQIIYTGIRPGEKLYEELFTDREGLSATRNERIFISKKKFDTSMKSIVQQIDLYLQEQLPGKKDSLNLICSILPDFHPPIETDNQSVLQIKKDKKVEFLRMAK